jgi:hypothetical protein
LKETRLYIAAKRPNALAPDVRGLDGCAVLQNGQQREHRAFREIGVLEDPAGVADDGAKLERNRFKMGIDPLAAGRLQGAEQPIALCIVFSAFWHNAIVEVPVKWGPAWPWRCTRSESCARSQT